MNHQKLGLQKYGKHSIAAKMANNYDLENVVVVRLKTSEEAARN